MAKQQQSQTNIFILQTNRVFISWTPKIMEQRICDTVEKGIYTYIFVFFKYVFQDALLRPKTFVLEKFDLEVLVLKIELYEKNAACLVKFRRERT